MRPRKPYILSERVWTCPGCKAQTTDPSGCTCPACGKVSHDWIQPWQNKTPRPSCDCSACRAGLDGWCTLSDEAQRFLAGKDV